MSLTRTSMLALSLLAAGLSLIACRKKYSTPPAASQPEARQTTESTKAPEASAPAAPAPSDITSESPETPVATAPAPPVPPVTPAAPAASDAIDARHLAKGREAVAKGLAFLLSQQNSEGGWGFAPEQSHPALTAMALTALLGSPAHGPTSPPVAKGFQRLLKFRQADGGFYVPGQGDQNYITSVAVMALARGGDQYRRELAGGVKYLRGLQIVPGSQTPDGDVVDDKHPYEGGVSYGKHGRPDMSNQGMWMQALHDAGVSGDDPAMQRALAFVARLQNRTEGTEGQVVIIGRGNDGGGLYAVHKEGDKFVAESKAGTGRRGLRSYGSMTYTGFKSMLYANVAHDDPRVQAAFEWIREYWRLDSNPNMPAKQSKEGLYYYYYVFAKALRAWGKDAITDKRGVKHNWRHELIAVLAAQQRSDGSWVNEASRWYESNPSLATCYALSALNETLAK